ncbi:hypothetical protein QI116_10745 [Staphylococcus saprophyticus]|nr:hypothetical protein [Staphylococcus saprophyticus]MDK1673579.1 hypothetical protein [Staphylococcus saprophyticus]MDW3800517.1 hypothetical protein [Staphylococcus saprophyticus]MDW3908310.1 hypothetical protein [Staphylococcus saprophyticus]MDW3927438.1 hypothetical protein [Staphylococcus saprophyticus]MDW3973238.1 hypothetical protein [Staphylococcus saprophyticus]
MPREKDLISLSVGNSNDFIEEIEILQNIYSELISFRKTLN